MKQLKFPIEDISIKDKRALWLGRKLLHLEAVLANLESHGRVSNVVCTFTLKQGGWAVRIKRHLDGNAQIAFWAGKSLERLLHKVFYDIGEQKVRWKVDKYYSTIDSS